MIYEELVPIFDKLKKCGWNMIWSGLRQQSESDGIHCLCCVTVRRNYKEISISCINWDDVYSILERFIDKLPFLGNDIGFVNLTKDNGFSDKSRRFIECEEGPSSEVCPSCKMNSLVLHYDGFGSRIGKKCSLCGYYISDNPHSDNGVGFYFRQRDEKMEEIPEKKIAFREFL